MNRRMIVTTDCSFCPFRVKELVPSGTIIWAVLMVKGVKYHGGYFAKERYYTAVVMSCNTMDPTEQT